MMEAGVGAPGAASPVMAVDVPVLVNNIDAGSDRDVQQATVYVKDIFSYFFDNEVRLVFGPCMIID